ncbi:GntR family transcriptional regulator [Robbsia sp. KACC 23696]|uniref:GntR family transcriptional regulator n=1 Tax=Robbsia sp. KACC 23696 TaxID=3149231 RepID=UPI00325AC9F8
MRRAAPSGEALAGRQPLYARIQQFVRNEIASGRLHEGDQIPTEADLCEQFQAARATVARAIQQLAYEGLIVRRPGSGSFVSIRSISTPLHLTQVTSFEDKLAGENGRVDYEVLGFSMRPAGDAHGASLHLPAEEKVFELRRLRLVEEQRTSLEVRVMPLDIGRAMTVDMLHTRSIHRILDELGRPVRQVLGKIRASVADGTTAEHLDVAQGSALLIRDYTLRDQAGEPIVCGESFYRAEYHIDYQVSQNG